MTEPGTRVSATPARPAPYRGRDGARHPLGSLARRGAVEVNVAVGRAGPAIPGNTSAPPDGIRHGNRLR